ncbi:MAG: site-specific integrase [Candidatus Eremiobacteraeota bacterium]|nr:site-specific integrase [Candidatus Eremiobacteraeota bacterium]
MSVKEISRKRKGTVYQTVVDLGRDPQGRRVQRRVTARTKRDLREKVDALRAERRNGVIVTRGRETLGALADRWLSSKRDACAHRTYASYVDIVESFIRPQLGHLTLRSLSPEDVERALNTWRVAQRRDHRKHSKTVPALLSNRTLRYIATVLRTLCNYGVRMRAIATNPAEFVALPRSEDYEATVLPIDRFAQLLQFARTWHDGDLSLHFLLAAAAGLRRGELCALQWGDVDLQHATITVRHAIEVRRDGSGIGINEPKGKKVAVLAIPEVLVQALGEWRAGQTLRLGSVTAETPVLDTEGAWSHPDRLSKITMRCIRASGVPRVRLHDLRHSYGSWLADAGVSTRVLQESLRHSSLTMTEHYTSQVGQAQRDAVATLGAQLRDAGVSAQPGAKGIAPKAEPKCD